MASVDRLFLGGGTGSDSRNSGAYRSAISYRLQQPSPLSLLEILYGWEIELRKGSATVVARSLNTLDRELTISIGTELIQRCLDLISFERLLHIELAEAGNAHIVLYVRDDQQVLERYITSDLPMGMSLKLTALDQDGNIIPDPPLPPPVWIPALRYYRLSQSSSNLYEAYRNLWLGLETLLSAISPKTINNKNGKEEPEGKWLRRVFTDITAQVNLHPYLPSTCTDVVDYFMDEQYVAMRCNLFHAKLGLAVGIPNIPSPEKIAIAYAQLIMIWRSIAQFLNVRSLGSGAVTYQGFKHMMDTALSANLLMACTEDALPPTSADTLTSPAGYTVIPFDETEYRGETTPGRVAIFGRLIIAKHAQIPRQYRITSSIQSTLFNVDYVEGGLDLSGLDLFESIQVIRLHNQGMPKTQF